jgi:hypothetical protein
VPREWDTTNLSIEVGAVLAEDHGKMNAVSLIYSPSIEPLTNGYMQFSRRFALHWPLEFPEVFEADRGGFDAFVGNRV